MPGLVYSLRWLPQLAAVLPLCLSQAGDLPRPAGDRGDKLAAARLLGIGKTTLYRKLKQYNAEACPKSG